jgi:hypothetical protein
MMPVSRRQLATVTAIGNGARFEQQSSQSPPCGCRQLLGRSRQFSSTNKTLHAWRRKPERLMPGQKMGHTLTDAIAYLKKVSPP